VVSRFRYRSSSYLTEFFQDCDTDHTHDGTTRQYWVADPQCSRQLTRVCSAKLTL